MNRKLKLLTLCFIAYLSFIGTVYALRYVLSPVSPQITISDYALSLNVSVNVLEVTFSGTLTHPSADVNGKAIEVYHCNIAGDLQGSPIATTTTQADGTYSIVATETPGTYYYRARATIP